MKYIFKNLGNRTEVDLVPYMKEKIVERTKLMKGTNDVSIYIGCDSQNIGVNTVYGLVVVLHYGNNGGNVLYSRMKVERIRDRFFRLWKEVEMSVEIAQCLEAEGLRAKYIDIDINPDPRYQSNKVLRSALGLIEASGFEARCKPDALAASSIADYICH